MINQKALEAAVKAFHLEQHCMSLEESRKAAELAITAYLPHHESELVEALKFYAEGKHWETTVFVNGSDRYVANICIERGNKAKQALSNYNKGE